MSNRKLSTIFLGTPEFALPTLNSLLTNSNIDLKLVVTMPDRKAGRGQQLTPPPVAQFAKDHNIQLIQTDNVNKCEDFFSFVQNEKIDLIIVLAFAQFLTNKILTIPSLGCFNIHTSLLPKYRGAAPIQYALLNGDNETGVTIQKMVKKMDAGDIAIQITTSISSEEKCEQLSERLSNMAADSINMFIEKIQCSEIQYQVQDESKVTFAPTLQKENGLIDFYQDDAKTIYNKIRALSIWPTTYFFLAKERVKIIDAEISSINLPAGKIRFDNKIAIGTKNQSIVITKIQPEGKKAITALEFINGLKNKKVELNNLYVDQENL